MADDLEFAFALAAGADEISRGFFERGFETYTKTDGSPVTEADLAVDRWLVEQLEAQRPDDAVLSEESGERAGEVGSGRRWILDPIDGTFNFAARRPHWGTHIALEVGGEIVLGVVTRPCLGGRWWAVRGEGAQRAFDGGKAESLSVSPRADLTASEVRIWTSRRDARHEALAAVVAIGTADMNDILELAAGRIDAVVSTRGAVWDNAPMMLLVEEAGGRYRDAAGGRRLDYGEAHFTNGAIDPALFAALGQ